MHSGFMGFPGRLRIQAVIGPAHRVSNCGKELTDLNWAPRCRTLFDPGLRDLGGVLTNAHVGSPCVISALKGTSHSVAIAKKVVFFSSFATRQRLAKRSSGRTPVRSRFQAPDLRKFPQYVNPIQYGQAVRNG